MESTWDSDTDVPNAEDRMVPYDCDGTYSPDKSSKMGLNGCGNFLKYSMFLFNAIILVAGCGLLGLGIYTRTSQTGITKVSAILGSNLYSILSLALMVTGGVVIVLSFLGCCGAIKEVRCMLVTFFALLLVMFFGLVVGGVLVYAYRGQIGEHTINELYRSLNSSYGMAGKDPVTNAWDFMQKIFGCCGVDGGINSTTSWAYYKENTLWYKNQTGIRRYIPDSCCKTQMSENLTKCTGLDYPKLTPAVGPPVVDITFNDQMFTEGCYTKFFAFLASNARILGGVGVGVAAMMVLGMTFALCLCRRIKDDYYFD
ncbi:CD151 antigen-like isoform X3 [Haliotis cracherodii]|uniref:CD151 antigen-like isoform X3 n=1 Tax=Haliotis rufescens TaxID=6454 RepID=UPI001EB076A3|nr:CD151 antigen-like isoform X3 [Haliotis rufescens]